MKDWESIIHRIEGVRKSNNHLWMLLLRLALEKSPARAKSILRQIRMNDLEVSDLTGELANGNRRKKNRKP